MRLLLDENLSRRLVPFLQHAFPGSSQVVLLGMGSASDKEVWQRAKDDGYVVVSRDDDFQELSLVWGGLITPSDIAILDSGTAVAHAPYRSQEPRGQNRQPPCLSNSSALSSRPRWMA